MKSYLPFILIALSIGLLYMYVWPEYGTISDLQMQKSEYDDALSKTKQLAALRDNLLSQYNAISPADKTKLESMIPDQFNSVKLVSDVSAVAAKYSLTVKGVNITEGDAPGASGSQVDLTATPPPSPYKVGTISFTVAGTYQNFLLFLKEIESSQELIDVRGLTIGGTKTSADKSSGNLDFGLKVETYFIN